MSVTRYRIPDRLAGYISTKDSSDIYMVMASDFDACAKVAVEMAEIVEKFVSADKDTPENIKHILEQRAQAVIGQYGGSDHGGI